jgi:hypothetical protein
VPRLVQVAAVEPQRLSRLRRAVGALVDTNPYRLAAGVALTFVGR